MDFLKGNPPSPEHLLPTVAREKTAAGTSPNSDNQQRPAPVGTMAYLRRAILVLTVCTLVLLGAASAGSLRAPCHRATPDAPIASGPSEPSSFSALLRSASPASLHDLLHRYFPERFRDGVWASERQAVEALHREDATLASSIVQLAKRDSTNSTSTSPISSATATETSSTSAAQSTSSTAVTITSTSTGPAPSSTSVVPPVTTTSTSPSSTPSSFRSSSSSRDNNTTMSTSTTPEHSSSSSSPSPTSTRTSKQIVETLTSTSPNGAVVVITATTYVAPDSPETPAPSSTNRATLQNAAFGRPRSGGPVLAAAVGLAVLLVAVV